MKNNKCPKRDTVKKLQKPVDLSLKSTLKITRESESFEVKHKDTGSALRVLHKTPG